MSKIEKILSKWKNPPPQIALRDVKSVLKEFGFDIDSKRGSHIVVRHSCLIGHDGFSNNGEFTIPTVHGRHVKKWYIKEIMKAISIIEEASEQ